MVNQHSQRINVLEIDKIGVEDVKKGNLELVNSAKLSPVFGKEIALQTVGKLDSFSEEECSFRQEAHRGREREGPDQIEGSGDADKQEDQ